MREERTFIRRARHGWVCTGRRPMTLCTSAFDQVFDVPSNVMAIYVVIEDKEHPEAVKLQDVDGDDNMILLGPGRLRDERWVTVDHEVADFASRLLLRGLKWISVEYDQYEQPKPKPKPTPGERIVMIQRGGDFEGRFRGETISLCGGTTESIFDYAGVHKHKTERFVMLFSNTRFEGCIEITEIRSGLFIQLRSSARALDTWVELLPKAIEAARMLHREGFVYFDAVEVENSE